MEITVKNIADLPAAARELIPHLPERGVVALYGGMGAGKTTLISALLREMGSVDEVSSPTFALVNDYLVEGENGGGDRHIYHFDFYRIDSPREAFDLGYEEYFYGDGLCLVEWPEKIEELLPTETLRLHIDTLPDDSRRISMTDNL
ncbi:MAG: tRNA (adenosine(37)-N6)-threonylcarbamoyltransferase complex ATPase subunit type 1 TsaE [Alistipes sp.]|jgi:tRNA threonylcarbamoyladenosine biosynthesis protein TsaE|nr:tRNA (adenosine(37)-N6)-threonylcarbamoyltransferase complex ATPase subunit type 1 TsaE [Alistipes sp.]